MSNPAPDPGGDEGFVPERDDLLKRWVKQPPANPNMQYLRDEERHAAVRQLGARTDVLDLASEANVTAAINAARIARLDFSPEASECAQAELDEFVDGFAVTRPEWPDLPFDDSTFHAAVSIGPFDWKFLDVDHLREELQRVITDDGHVVFSIPTPRSPYSAADSYRFRYLTPDQALRFVSPDWLLTEYDLLFQYPNPIHTAINKMPDIFQVPFTYLARGLTRHITALDWWNVASYLVLGMQSIDYATYLEAALECLFRSVENDGFWNLQQSRIVRALEYSFSDDGLEWRLDDSNEWRYAPFALMGVMRWRSSLLGRGTFDQKIKQALEYFAEQVEIESSLASMPSYGIGPLIVGYSLAADTFDEPQYGDFARRLYQYSKERFDFTHAEDSLLLFGWCHLYRYEKDERLRTDIADGLWTINERLAPDNLFHFDNSTTLRHQNQMYTLWGLCEAIEVTGADGYLESAEQVLNYTIENRMREDGAFIWDDVKLKRKIKRALHKRVGGRPPHWDFLYECHQTFFVNAVMSYYRAGGTENYDREVREAMAWIYQNNGLETDLVEYSGLGVPMRQMTVDTRMDVSGQMYKGAYELGSYIMALTDLLIRY